MYKQIITLSLILVLSYSLEFPNPQRTTIENLESYTFEQYVLEYEKTYINPTEFTEREQIFYENLIKIIEFNADKTNTITLGINQFADMTLEDMKTFKGHKIRIREQPETNLRVQKPTLKDFPDTVDWRKKGVVSKVKNQGGCGSCWAFSATETLESRVAIAKGGDAPEFSPQEFVDCVENPQECGGTGGCEGATEELAFAYAIKNGIASKGDYEYTGMDGKCKMSGLTPVAHITSYVNVTSNDLSSLMKAIQTGPVSISVAASGFSWQFYFGGVVSHCSANADLDHGVQLVGYDKSDTSNMYWIVRNSWGAGWGESGYIRLRMRDTDKVKCGTDETPLDGSGCKGGPSTVPVCGECGILYDNSYPVV